MIKEATPVVEGMLGEGLIVISGVEMIGPVLKNRSGDG